MYDQHIICPGTLHQVLDGGRAVGFALDARLPYYRGQPLSVVEDIQVSVDGTRAPRADVRLTVGGQTWTLDELADVTTRRWEFGAPARVTVLRPGGLAAGPHEVQVALQLRISYLPWSPVTSCTQTMSAADAAPAAA